MSRPLIHPRLIRLLAGVIQWVLLFSAAAGEGPAWFFRGWQTDEGLPDNAVVGIAQTPDGFLWVATQGGLVRFDGNQFRKFTAVTEAGVRSGLLHGLAVDRKGVLQVAKDGGMLVSVDAGRTTSLVLRKGSGNAWGMSMMEDGEGNLWAAYPTTTSRVVRVRDGQARYFGEEDGLVPASPAQLARDRTGRIWCASGERLGVFQGDKFVVLGTVRGLQAITAAQEGGLWICAGTRVMRFTADAGAVSAGELPSLRPDVDATAALEDRAGRLWVGTGKLGLFRREGEAFVSAPTSHREILSLAEDREGNIWVGTRGGGLNRLRPSVVESQEIASGLPFEAVRSVCQDRDGVLWAVARSGVVARQQGGGWSVLGAAQGWNVPDAMSVVADGKGGVWIGTHYHGLFLWRDGVVGSWSMQDGLAGNFARSLLASTNGDLWIGTASAEGLHRLRGGELRRFELPTGSGLVRAMALDGSGTLWAGTAGGFLLRVTEDAVVDETARSVPRLQTIRCLHSTPDGCLWIGYGGDGVGRLKAGVFTQFRGEGQISDDYISQIQDDADGRLWFAGNRGIFHLRQRELETRASGAVAGFRPVVFGRDEGLPALQASREAWPGAVRARDGRIWIAMQTGLAVVHPAEIQHKPAPRVVIESVAADGETLAAYDTPVRATAGASAGLLDLRAADNRVIQVPPGHEQLAVEFTALSFVSPRNVAFRFRLEGMESEWVEAGARRVAYYSHLPSGRYQFHVTAADEAGEWNEAGTRLGIEVLPYYWQTWWFRVLAGILVVGMVVGGVRFIETRRLHRQVEQAERGRAVERERARIAKDIHDDLGASLTEITLLSELAQSGEAPAEERRADMRKIAARTRQLTLALDATVWAVNPRNDTLESLVSYTCQQAEDFCKVARIRCRLDVPSGLPGQSLTAVFRHNVFLVAKEALNNVVKHSGASEVSLRILPRHAGLLLAIEDNGRGFNPESVARNDPVPPDAVGPGRRRGQGLSNMRRRAAEIGGRLGVFSEPGRGTRIELEVDFAPGLPKPPA